MGRLSTTECTYLPTSLVTTTSGECSDEQETPAVSTPLADTDHHLSKIASDIPPVDPEVLTLKHSAFRATLNNDVASATR